MGIYLHKQKSYFQWLLGVAIEYYVIAERVFLCVSVQRSVISAEMI